ncbi:MAG TPA: septal ring lytic transglycosylase RlpA family protein [Microvirga sp.]|nr:septal ring lytic transglycosylase RlpA family protein [Microvirga sp.]
MTAVGCGPAQAEPFASGTASWYGPGFHDRPTASGERFDAHELTAAHKTLPFGTKVQVTNTKTGRSVAVRINDRGPYAHGRIIDLSKAAAESIGMSGRADVTLARFKPRGGQS